MSLKTKISFVSACALPLAAIVSLFPGREIPAEAAGPANSAGTSPALCGVGDIKEPGIQGDVPAGQKTGNYNCGVRLVGQLPRVGNVQGIGKCAYVRSRTDNPMAGLDTDKDGKISLKEWTDGKRDPAQFATFDLNKDGVIGTAEQAAQIVYVIDVSDPAKPVEVRSVPVRWASETMRVVVTKERAILVSGSSVYDIKDCLNPVLMGEIKWPQLSTGISQPNGGGGGTGQLPHDLRVNYQGTRVYGSFGLWEADITNLKDPKSWKVTDHRCDINAQIPGPWQEVHRVANKAGTSLCADAANPQGANYRNAGSGLQSTLMWPQLAHGLDANGEGTRVYVADQAFNSALSGPPMMHIIDVTKSPVKVVGATNGPGHAVDWFRTGGRDYVLHSNEGGTEGIGPAKGSDTCRPYPRPSELGWAFEAYLSDVTGDKAKNVSMLKIAINNPENCQARKASGKDPWVAYHLIDDQMNAHFAAVNFGSAGLRIYDIRQPTKPTEVAYFNHGSLVHGGIGYYDAARGLIYAAGSSGFWVLQVEPQVKAKLGL